MQTHVGTDVKKAANYLSAGELVAFATETVYGLGAPLFRVDSVAKIFSVKGRPSDNPLIAHIAHLEEALQLTETLSSDFIRLAERFWPGPLTLVVPKRKGVPQIVSGGNPTIAIRMPAHPLARSLLEEMKEPLVAPSANLSGRPSPTSAADVIEDLGGLIPYVLDGGTCSIGIESTVLSLVTSPYVLLRPGEILKEEIEELLRKSILVADATTPITSPGMKYRHYAPKAKVRLAYRLDELEGAFVLSRRPILGRRSYPLTAKGLYHAFRQADRDLEPLIEVYCDAETIRDAALMNRLKAASFQVEEIYTETT